MLQSRAGGLVAERRVARSRPQGASGDVCAPAPRSNRPNKLKLWSEEQMSLAVEGVRSGEMGVRRAHQEFGVPKSIPAQQNFWESARGSGEWAPGLPYQGRRG